MDNTLFWFLLNLISIIVAAFFSMEEMACVSFNRIRLHYYVSKGKKQAIWLNYLLEKPERLFGTTLLGVNVAMFFGSECARQFYLSLNINPDYAPLTQVVLVVIFGELAPMFAARRYAEHVAMLGSSILYLTAILLKPLLFSLNLISRFADFILGKRSEDAHVVLNQEDLQRILSFQDEDIFSENPNNVIARNIFSIRNKDAKEIMGPLNQIPSYPNTTTVEMARKVFSDNQIDAFTLYHRDKNHIVGIVSPKNLIRATDQRKVRDFASSPWFITQQTKILQILKEFKRNNNSIAIVLNARGIATGLITLDDVMEEIFGKFATESSTSSYTLSTFFLDRTFAGNFTVEEFNKEFKVPLKGEPQETLSELIIHQIGHIPEKGESIFITPYELTAEETTLLEIKKVNITSHLD